MGKLTKSAGVKFFFLTEFQSLALVIVYFKYTDFSYAAPEQCVENSVINPDYVQYS